MAPEYRGETTAGKKVVVFTSKSPGSGFWQGRTIPLVSGHFELKDGVNSRLRPTEEAALAEAVREHQLTINDTWPPKRPNIGYRLGQLLSAITFGK